MEGEEEEGRPIKDLDLQRISTRQCELPVRSVTDSEREIESVKEREGADRANECAIFQGNYALITSPSGYISPQFLERRGR